MTDTPECGCKADIEAKLLANFKKASPEATSHSVELLGYGFVVDGKFMPYEAKADYRTKAGSLKTKKLKGIMVFSFCPFCGNKL